MNKELTDSIHPSISTFFSYEVMMQHLTADSGDMDHDDVDHENK